MLWLGCVWNLLYTKSMHAVRNSQCAPCQRRLLGKCTEGNGLRPLSVSLPMLRPSMELYFNRPKKLQNGTWDTCHKEDSTPQKGYFALSKFAL